MSFNTYYRNQSLTASWTFPEYTLMFDNIGTSLNPWVRDGEGNETWIQSPLDINVGGLQGDYYKDLYYEASLNYDRSFGKNSVSGLFLFNRHQNDPNTEYSYYNESWVGRATYDYAKKYLLEFNVGYTGSERFAPSNRFGFFPSAAVGWVASEEPFIKKNAPWLSLLKFRYSDGLVGSDYASSRWLYMTSSIIRLAELYLNYAEAANEAYGPDGSAPGATLTAAQALNVVRNRVNMPDIGSRYTASRDLFRERVKNERTVELNMEGHRWVDVRRWKDAPTVYAGPLYGMDIQYVGKSKEYPTGFKYTRVELEAARQVKWKDFMWYFPFNTSDYYKFKNFDTSSNPLWQ